MADHMYRLCHCLDDCLCRNTPTVLKPSKAIQGLLLMHLPPILRVTQQQIPHSASMWTLTDSCWV
jgi:hypothetical protein